MAGIGFELRRIVADRRPLHMFQGGLFAVLIAAGPLLTSVVLLLVVQLLLKLSNIDIIVREQISALITYCFIFAMLASSGPAMLLTRFIADRLYSRSFSGIRSSPGGALAIVCLLSLTISLSLFIGLKHPLAVRLLACQLLIELACVYLLMAYISAIHAYLQAGIAYVTGAGASVLFVWLLLVIGLPPIDAVLLALVIGYGFCLLQLVRLIVINFPQNDSYVSADSVPAAKLKTTAQFFAFLPWLRHMPELLLINSFYAFALFSHNFIVWLGGGTALRTAGGLIFDPLYDTACFLAVITVLPAAVRFLISTETIFYEKFENWLAANTDQPRSEIILKREEMTSCLWRQLGNLMAGQAVVSIFAGLVGSRIILPLFGADPRLAGLLPIMCIGFYLLWMTFIVTTFVLYFDRRREALLITLLLWLATSYITWLLLPGGETLYGLGLISGSLIALIYALLRLRYVLRNVDYLIYKAGDTSVGVIER